MSLFKRFAASAALIASGFLAAPAAAQDNESLERLARIVEAWLASPHGDAESRSFNHWNEDGEIPGVCATCHSNTGFRSYVSGSMQVPGIIDHPVGLGTTVDCTTCHGQAATALTAVPFPSGVSVDTFGTSASCAVCHQGRASTDTVANATDGLDDDTVNPELTFINVHFSASAATQMGSVVRGGYQYDGRDYKGQFTHVPDFASCTSCHWPHSLEPVPVASCTTCHTGVENFAAIRTSQVDFDGDGNITEGIADPIATLHGLLYEAIQAYGSDVAGTPIIYADSFPYFYTDSDGDGAVSEGEAAFPNRYQNWTPRLLKAAYNYQFIAKDKAAYTHNPHYALQLLYDSLESLSTEIDIDMAGLNRP